MRRLITGPGRVSALVGEAERRREHAVRVEVPAWADEWLSRARSTGLPVRALICTNIPLLGYARGAYCFQSGEVWLWADEEWAMRQVLLHEFGHAARRSLSMDTGDRDLLAGWARDERETWQAAYVLAQDWGLGGWMTEADLDSRLAEVATAHRRYEMVGARLGCGWRGPVERALDLAESWDPPRHLFAPESLRRPTPGARMRDGDRLSALGGEGALARALHVAREMCGMARVPLALHGRIELRGEDDLAMAIGGLSDLLFAPYEGEARLVVDPPRDGSPARQTWRVAVSRAFRAELDASFAPPQIVRVEVSADWRAGPTRELAAAWTRWLGSWSPAAAVVAGARRLPLSADGWRRRFQPAALDARDAAAG